MNEDEEVWGPANVLFPDWKGSVQLDYRMTGPWDLYDAIGLDKENWVLVGLSIHSGEDGSRSMNVYATPYDAWHKEKKDATVDLEVTEFYVHDVDPFEILERMTHVFDLRMRLRYLEERRFVIRSRSDLPHGKFEHELFDQALRHGVIGSTKGFGPFSSGSNPGASALLDDYNRTSYTQPMPLYGDKKREYQRKWIAQRKAEYFKGKTCTKCGTSDDLQLDHIDRTKKVSHSIWSWSQVRREAELDKCQVLCIPCHRTKTNDDVYGDWKHGTTRGYWRHNCRCDKCKQAVTQWFRDYRWEKKHL